MTIERSVKKLIPSCQNCQPENTHNACKQIITLRFAVKTHLKLDVQTRNTVQNDSKTLPRLIPYLDESFGGFVRRLQTVFGHATCEKFSAVLHLEADPVDLLPVTRFCEKLGQGACQKPIERFEVINRSEAGRSKQTVIESRRAHI